MVFQTCETLWRGRTDHRRVLRSILHLFQSSHTRCFFWRPATPYCWSIATPGWRRSAIRRRRTIGHCSFHFVQKHFRPSVSSSGIACRNCFHPESLWNISWARQRRKRTGSRLSIVLVGDGTRLILLYARLIRRSRLRLPISTIYMVGIVLLPGVPSSSEETAASSGPRVDLEARKI